MEIKLKGHLGANKTVHDNDERGETRSSIVCFFEPLAIVIQFSFLRDNS